MAWSHVMAVYEHTPDCSHVAMCVLVALAKMSDGRGECYPSAEYLAEKTKMSVRSVTNGLGELKMLGIVEWESGKHNGVVNKYRINEQLVNRQSTKSVDNEDGRHQMPTGSAPLAEGVGTRCRGGRNVVPTRSAPRADKDNKEDTKEVSKLVCKHGHQTEESLAKKDNQAKDGPPKAAGKDEYTRLFKTFGWKPQSKRDVEFAVWYCYTIGASNEEAKAFGRYNNLRRWNGINGLSSVHQLAKEWVKKWKRDDFDAYYDEQVRRRKQRKESA